MCIGRPPGRSTRGAPTVVRSGRRVRQWSPGWTSSRSDTARTEREARHDPGGSFPWRPILHPGQSATLAASRRSTLVAYPDRRVGSRGQPRNRLRGTHREKPAGRDRDRVLAAPKLAVARRADAGLVGAARCEVGRGSARMVPRRRAGQRAGCTKSCRSRSSASRWPPCPGRGCVAGPDAARRPALRQSRIGTWRTSTSASLSIPGEGRM